MVNSSTSKNKSVSLEIQIRSLRLGGILLGKCKDTQWVKNLGADNIVLPSLLISLCCPMQSVRKAALKVVQVLRNCIAGGDAYGFLLKQIESSALEINLDSE